LGFSFLSHGTTEHFGFHLVVGATADRKDDQEGHQDGEDGAERLQVAVLWK
jgi:hypothetical protein